MNLTAGILIIGSLYWDVDREKKPHRFEWGNKRLDKDGELVVNVPIRYGRKSKNRNNTFTMAFSLCCKPGVARILPCRNAVRSVNDLETEAKALWAAEQADADRARCATGVSASWGRVALLCNPELPPSTYKSVTEGWATCIQQMRYKGGDPAPDGAVVDSRGILQIPWPRIADTNEPTSLDLLLATATSPTVNPDTGDYFSVNAIAEAWNADQDNKVEYFYKNRLVGIVTFQDDEIVRRLSSPCATRD